MGLSQENFTRVYLLFNSDREVRIDVLNEFTIKITDFEKY